MTTIADRSLSDRDLMIKGFQVLVAAFGDVNAERFITLAIRDPEDYTQWRERNMYVGESVHDVAQSARASGKRLRKQMGITV